MKKNMDIYIHTHICMYICMYVCIYGASQVAVVKNLPANAGDLSSISGSERSPDVGNGNPLHYSCLENPMERGAWWSTVHKVEKSWT